MGFSHSSGMTYCVISVGADLIFPNQWASGIWALVWYTEDLGYVVIYRQFRVVPRKSSSLHRLQGVGTTSGSCLGPVLCCRPISLTLL